MSDKQLITITKEIEGYLITLTQEYSEIANRGHYNYAIMRADHLLSVG